MFLSANCQIDGAHKFVPQKQSHLYPYIIAATVAVFFKHFSLVKNTSTLGSSTMITQKRCCNFFYNEKLVNIVLFIIFLL